MSDKMSEVYEAYDMEVIQTMRGRGATILKTDKGLFQLKIPEVNESRLNAEFEFKEKLYLMGYDKTDRCIKNKQDELVTFDRYNNPYVLRQYYDGRECNATSPGDISLAIENLAKLHIACKKVFDSTESDVHIRVSGDFRRRNQELKRVRNYIARKKSKKTFEELYIKAYDYFYKQALACQDTGMDNNDTGMNNRHLGYCHGMYNHHSVLISQSGTLEPVVQTINFDRFYVGNQLDDLYHFIRKIVEKNNYSFDIMIKMLNDYSKICKLDSDDIDYIYTLYCYPEKFYKISNQYINSPKNWISPKMIEKLSKVMEDEEQKIELLCELKKYKSQIN